MKRSKCASQNSGITNKRADRLILAVHAATNAKSFTQASFRLLKLASRCDWSLAHWKVTGVGQSMLGWDSLGRTYGSEFWDGFFAVNPGVPYVVENPGIKLFPTKGNLGLEGEAALRKSVFYLEYMKPMGWRHAVGLFFWNGQRSDMELSFSVFRREGNHDFSEVDLTALLEIYDHINVARKRLKRELDARTARDGLARILRHDPGGALVVNQAFKPAWANLAARRAIEEWTTGRMTSRLKNPTRIGALPEVLAAACRNLRDDWIKASKWGETPSVTSLTVSNPTSPSSSACVRLLASTDPSFGSPMFLIIFSSSEDTRITPVIRATALTASQREVAEMAASGLADKEIAIKLHRSIESVKFLLHQTYRRLGIHSRRELSNRKWIVDSEPE